MIDYSINRKTFISLIRTSTGKASSFLKKHGPAGTLVEESLSQYMEGT